MYKNFLFSSVGDNTDFDSLWINNNMEYDLYVIYYGNNEIIFNKYKSKGIFIERRKGSKFQNFKYFYDKYFNIINKYDRFFILDDDIIINVDDINCMFKISRQYNLDICAPSFSRKGKISHIITLHKPHILLSYTNFVEVNALLYNKNSINKLMEKLDYSLVGWGIDYLSIICNGIDKKKSYAIIHKIVCVNPFDKKKNNGRELNKVTNFNKRALIWDQFAKKHKIRNIFKHIVYENIPLVQIPPHPFYGAPKKITTLPVNGYSNSIWVLVYYSHRVILYQYHNLGKKLLNKKILDYSLPKYPITIPEILNINNFNQKI